MIFYQPFENADRSVDLMVVCCLTVIDPEND
jgi:hypothetical protein